MGPKSCSISGQSAGVMGRAEIVGRFVGCAVVFFDATGRVGDVGVFFVGFSIGKAEDTGLTFRAPAIINTAACERIHKASVGKLSEAAIGS